MTYDPQLLRTVTRILDGDPERDFYIFRNPACRIPPIRYPNAIHRILDAVPVDRLFVVDTDAFDEPEDLA